MGNPKVLRMEPTLVSIPVDRAVYCESCRKVSNSLGQRCGSCGSEPTFRLTDLIDPPPGGPNSGPAPAACSVPTMYLETFRAA
jgi:hypothetical protein